MFKTIEQAIEHLQAGNTQYRLVDMSNIKWMLKDEEGDHYFYSDDEALLEFLNDVIEDE